jgi:hypothetical protein
MRNKVALLTLATFILQQPVAIAAIPNRLSSTQIVYSNSVDTSKVLDLTQVKVVRPATVQYEKYLPLDMTPTDNSGRVAARIMDHALAEFAKDPAFRESSLFRSAQQVNNVVDAKVDLGSTPNVGQRDVTQHSLRFQMKPLDTTATLNYKGWLNANVSYQASANQMNVEVFKELSQSTRIAVLHNQASSQAYSGVSFQVTF